jgi:hypothetical protein
MPDGVGLEYICVQTVHGQTWLYRPFDKTFSLEPDVDKAAPILRNTIRHHPLPIKARLRGSEKKKKYL